ncbi:MULTISPECIES: amino acid ABC transporter permease [unclassified Phycicoccus]|jgi:glutamate transport system permease protein|uniref:amino acid ABC transporter permease n=1 Tax=unclassified Phycicoccus TaxID=2637926 RepID=UPI00070274D1|nr:MULTISPECIES: amino acid ABC transporter permease [unclassified Phycicoccus]KQU66333.1 glutamate ABC transporter permease [Phycicoccus sp. Root101]KQZ87482.1 glutamate ABC transporter permease [Phycicoccus sp. Root563]
MGDILSKYDVLGAFGMTVYLAFFSAIGSLLLGTVVGIMRLSPVRVLRLLGTGYVNIFRNTPLTLLVVLSVLGLTYILGLNLDPSSITGNASRWAIVMLSIYHASFVCEALRSGVNTIPAGQAEAARAIGLTFGQSMREVLLPQAFRGAIAPLGSTLIALIKNTTVAAVVGVAEAANLMAVIIENETGGLVVFLVFAIGFVILTLPLGLAFTSLSRRLAVKR